MLPEKGIVNSRAFGHWSAAEPAAKAARGRIFDADNWEQIITVSGGRWYP